MADDPTVALDEVSPADADQLITISALAHRWSVSTKFIYDRIRSGELEAVKLGRMTRIVLASTGKLIKPFAAAPRPGAPASPNVISAPPCKVKPTSAFEEHLAETLNNTGQPEQDLSWLENDYSQAK